MCRFISLKILVCLFYVTPLFATTYPQVNNQTFNPSSVQPNFLIFISDDLTFRDIGTYGNPDVKTPNIDKFAAQGLKFNLAFSSSSTCAPTRMELYTGLQPVRSGGHPNHGKVYDDVRSLPNYLRPLGYRVALMGKRHEAPHKNFGFDFLGGMHHDGNHKKLDLNLDLARQFWQTTKKPWALVVATNQPHTPWFRGDTSKYKPDMLTVPKDLIDTPETRRAMAAYYAEITYMDNQFGTILSMLEASGQSHNTLIFYLSEQGSNFPFAKWTLYDSGHRAAVIAKWAGKIKAGSNTDAIIQYADILPTLIEAAGGDTQNINLDGKSLYSLLTLTDSKQGKEQAKIKAKTQRSAHRQYAFGVQTTRGIFNGPDSYPIRTVRSSNYRLVWNLNYKSEFSNTVTARGGPTHTLASWKAMGDKGLEDIKLRAQLYSTRPEFELFDLENDPYELTNLADNAAYAKIKSIHFNALKEWMIQQSDKGLITEKDVENRKEPKGRNYKLGIPKGSKTLDWVY